MNLCLRTGEARRLGLDSHVCELQLILTAFLKLMVKFLPPIPPQTTGLRRGRALTRAAKSLGA